MTIEYALITPDGIVDRYSFNIDPKTGTKPGYKWVPVEEIKKEISDPSQIYDSPVVSVLNDKLVKTWNPRSKTEKEIEREKNAKLDRLDPSFLLDVLLDLENRCRVLESNKTVTKDEFRDILKSMM